jgi:hypothetical protein
MRHSDLDAIELVLACWRLATTNPIDLSHGSDQFAVRVAEVMPKLPDWVSAALDTVDRGYGPRLCYPDDIINRAWNHAMLQFDGSTFTRATPLYGEQMARTVARRHGLSTADAVKIGQDLIRRPEPSAAWLAPN